MCKSIFIALCKFYWWTSYIQCTEFWTNSCCSWIQPHSISPMNTVNEFGGSISTKTWNHPSSFRSMPDKKIGLVFWSCTVHVFHWHAAVLMMTGVSAFKSKSILFWNLFMKWQADDLIYICMHISTKKSVSLRVPSILSHHQLTVANAKAALERPGAISSRPLAWRPTVMRKLEEIRLSHLFWHFLGSTYWTLFSWITAMLDFNWIYVTQKSAGIMKHRLVLLFGGIVERRSYP